MTNTASPRLQDRSPLLPAILLGLAYAICGPALGAVILTVLGSILGWQPETNMSSPALAYVVIAFVSGALPLFVAGAAMGWLVPPHERGRAVVLSIMVAAILGGLWGIVGGLSHPEEALWISIVEVAAGCAIAAAVCGIIFGSVRKAMADRRVRTGMPS
ncbi:MAG: hypothetical protein AB7O56_07295 [Bauldia sp.]